jgi:hypothetical protein
MMVIRIIFHSKIVKLEQRSQLVSTRVLDHNKPATSDNMAQTYEDRGWFVTLEGSWEALCVGKEKPEGWEIGDVIKTTMERAS